MTIEKIGKYKVIYMWSDNHWHLYLDGQDTSRSYARLTDARRAIKNEEAKQQETRSEGDKGGVRGMTKDEIKQKNTKLTVEQAADRVLVVICALTGGNTQVSVSKAEVMAECERLGILEMSDSEFNDYLKSVGRVLDARQN